MDYNKIQVRASDMGLNVANDPSTLPFGKFQVNLNTETNVEGQITARFGLAALSSAATADGTALTNVRRLNDSVRGYSTYIVRTATKLDATTTAGNLASTANPFTFRSNGTGYLTTGMSSTAGNICIDRTSLSNQVWAYCGDATKMVKVAINSSQTFDVKTIGITRPTGPPTFAQSNTGPGALTLLGTYYYRYTLYDSSTGVESLYNSADDTTGITLTGANDTITVTIPTETVNSAVDKVRLYRKGGTLSTWQYVTQAAYTGTTVDIVDVASDLSITASAELDTVSNVPFTCTNSSGADVAGVALPYNFGPINGYQLAVGDPNNPGYLYWSNKFNPDSQDPSNRVEVTSPQDPLQNGFVYDGKGYAFSKEGLYYMVLGLGTSTWTPFKTSCGHGLASPHAFCVGPEIYYLGKDGIYATSGGAERSLTADELRPLFQGTNLGGIAAVDYAQISSAFMVYNDNKVKFMYKGTDSNFYCLVYELIYQRWKAHNFRIGITALYDDEEVTSREIVTGGGGRLYLYSGTTDTGGSPATIPVTVWTGTITLNAPLIHKEWGALIFDLNPAGASVTVTAYTDKGATSIATATWNDATRSRKILSLADTFSEDLTIAITWATSGTAPIIYGYELLYRPDVVQLSRWSITGVNHGIQGWQILRSGYITLRSDGNVVLTITPDNGTQYNYTIPTTGGNKSKVFIPFDPIKGKLFNYVLTLTSGTYFRLYNSDCEINVKPWVTSLGYARVNPFVGGDGGTPIGGDTGQNIPGPGNNSLGGSDSGGGQSNLGNLFNTDQWNYSQGGGGQAIIPPNSQSTTTSGGLGEPGAMPEGGWGPPDSGGTNPVDQSSLKPDL